MKARWSLLFVLLSLFHTSLSASTLVLLDNSGSMGEMLANGARKSIEASRALSGDLIAKMPDNERTAIWAFGGSCRSFQLKGRLGTKNQLLADLGRLGPPEGGTPLTNSIAAALEELKSLPEPRYLLVVTDGIDTCGGDPCAIVRQAGAVGAKISIHTIGLGMSARSGEFRVLQCMADASYRGSSKATDQVATAGPDWFERERDEGELLVKVVDSRGAEKSVGYLARSADGSIERRGMSGRALKLPAGRYEIDGGGGVSGTVDVERDRRREVEFAPNLGHLTLVGACAEGLGFAVEDAQGRTVQTGGTSGDAEIDLPPGSYRITLTGYPRLEPILAVVEKNRVSPVSLPAFGTLRVAAEDAGGGILDLPLEIFDDRASSDATPVASGETNRDFRLPVGVYNVRVSPDDPRGAHFQGGENIAVNHCERATASLLQRASLFVCGSGDVGVWNNSTGSFIRVPAGREVPLQPGVYNLSLPDGKQVFNVRVTEGVHKVNCPSTSERRKE